MDKCYCSVHRFECFALAIMTWLIFTEFLCHYYHEYAPFVLSTSLSFLNSWFIIAIVARAGCTSWVWTTYPSGAPELTPGVKRDSPCPIFSFLRSILWIVVYPFVPFCLAIVLSVFQFTDSNYPFGTFKLFVNNIRRLLQVEKELTTLPELLNSSEFTPAA